MSELARCGAIAYIARLLSFVPLADAVPVAERLVAKFGNVDAVVGATVAELMAIDGMTEPAAMLLCVTGALASRRMTEDFRLGVAHTEEEIMDYLIGLYIGSSQETVYMLIFDKDRRVTAVEHMGEGTVGASEVYPRKLLEIAVKSKAASVILAHNHPRGGATASDDDIVATRQLSSLFFSAGIELAAHYVVAGRDIEPVNINEE